jgi:hypothetical protein
MSTNDTETIDSTNDETEEVVKTEAVEEVVDADVDETEDDGDLEALREKNKRLFERTKKAEAEAKLLKAERLKKEEKAKVEAKPAEKQDGLTSMDAILLMGAKVTEKEDIELVAEYAKFKGVSIADALKSSIVKAELAEKAEVRATAAATNTGTARRGTSRPTDEQIIANMESGKEVDPEALAEARLNLKKSKK